FIEETRLALQEGHRHAVHHQVMDDQGEPEALRTRVQDDDPQERTALQVERPAHDLAREAVELADEVDSEVDLEDRGLAGLREGLERMAVHPDEAGAERLVARPER